MSTAYVFWQHFILALALTICFVGAAREALRMWHEHQDEQLTHAIAQRLREKETRLSVN